MQASDSGQCDSDRGQCGLPRGLSTVPAGTPPTGPVPASSGAVSAADSPRAAAPSLEPFQRHLHVSPTPLERHVPGPPTQACESSWVEWRGRGPRAASHQPLSAGPASGRCSERQPKCNQNASSMIIKQRRPEPTLLAYCWQPSHRPGARADCHFKQHTSSLSGRQPTFSAGRADRFRAHIWASGRLLPARQCLSKAPARCRSHWQRTDLILLPAYAKLRIRTASPRDGKSREPNITPFFLGCTV